MRNISMMMVLVMAVGMGCVGCGSEKIDQAAATEVETESAGEVSVFGKAEAIDEEEIYIDFPAHVTKVLVEEGQLVKEGEQLIALNYDEYKNTIQSASVEKQLKMVSTKDSVQEVAAIGSEIDALEKQKTLKESYLQDSNYQIQTLESTLDVVSQKLKKAEEDYEAERALLEAGASSEEAVKELKLNIEALGNEKQNTEKQLQSFKESTKLEVDQLSASIKGKQDEMSQKKNTNTRAASKEALNAQISDLSIENMNDKLNKSYLKDGYIVSDLKNAIIEEIICKKGSYLGGEEPTYCMKLLDEDSIQVVADVPEEFMSQVAVGQICKVVPYYDNTLAFEGKVVRMDHRAVKEDGEVIVKSYIKLTDPSAKIMPGISVDVIF